MTTREYVGSELDLFARAVRWKAYFARTLRPHLGGDVLEVGAGKGGTTPFVWHAGVRSWTCLEPDPGQAAEISAKIACGALPANCRARNGTLSDLERAPAFDAIAYLDVLEHIEDDAREAEAAGQRLRRGGCLVVLAPAHQGLFTPFDAAVGHFRRYTKRTLAALAPPGLVLERLFYLDSVGMLASLANRLLLRQSMPTAGQIAFWDSVLVPMSRVGDALTLHALGKSVVAIWRRPA